MMAAYKESIMNNYNFESGFHDWGVKICALCYWALFLLFVGALAYAAGVLVIFEDQSWLIRLGGRVILSGCFPFGICGL